MEPKIVYRVLYDENLKPFVATRELIAKSGSWYTTRRRDGSTVKENGNNWSDTVTEAIQREAESLMNRYHLTTCFSQRDQIRSMDALIVEAMEWGRLLGQLEGLKQKAEAS